MHIPSHLYQIHTHTTMMLSARSHLADAGSPPATSSPQGTSELLETCPVAVKGGTNTCNEVCSLPWSNSNPGNSWF